MFKMSAGKLYYGKCGALTTPMVFKATKDSTHSGTESWYYGNIEYCELAFAPGYEYIYESRDGITWWELSNEETVAFMLEN